MKRWSIVSEYLQFLREQKKYWMIPIILFLLLMGALVVVFEGSVLAPFIYAVF